MLIVCLDCVLFPCVSQIMTLWRKTSPQDVDVPQAAERRFMICSRRRTVHRENESNELEAIPTLSLLQAVLETFGETHRQLVRRIGRRKTGARALGEVLEVWVLHHSLSCVWSVNLMSFCCYAKSWFLDQSIRWSSSPPSCSDVYLWRQK